MDENSWTDSIRLISMARHESPPPPYVPVPIEGETHRGIFETDSLSRTRPKAQFKAQARHEKEQFKEQLSAGQHKDKFKTPIDLKVYAENSVRSKWKLRGFWRNDWGPAWPEDSRPSLPSWSFTVKPEILPCHIPEDSFWPDENELGRHRDPPPETAEKQQKLLQELLNGDWDQCPGQAPLPLTSASRPSNLFFHLVLDEMERLHQVKNDEQSQLFQTLGARAIETVKRMWLDQGIWDVRWEQTPGWTWPHNRHGRSGLSSPAKASAISQCNIETACDDVPNLTPCAASFGIFSNRQSPKRSRPETMRADVGPSSRLDSSKSGATGPNPANSKRRRGSDDHEADNRPVKRPRQQRSKAHCDQASIAQENLDVREDTMSPRLQLTRPIAGSITNPRRRHTKTPSTRSRTSQPPRRSERIAQIRDAHHQQC